MKIASTLIALLLTLSFIDCFCAYNDLPSSSCGSCDFSDQTPSTCNSCCLDLPYLLTSDVTGHLSLIPEIPCVSSILNFHFAYVLSPRESPDTWFGKIKSHLALNIIQT